LRFGDPAEITEAAAELIAARVREHRDAGADHAASRSSGIGAIGAPIGGRSLTALTALTALTSGPGRREGLTTVGG
jgi:hypothetical protein